MLFRSSFVCSAKNRAGAVHDLLVPLKAHGVSMSKLESRPARGRKGSLFEYVFFIDVEGHRQDPAVGKALDELRSQVGFLKELGSYPRSI